MDTPASDDPAARDSQLWEHRDRLLNLARRNLNPILAKGGETNDNSSGRDDGSADTV